MTTDGGRFDFEDGGAFVGGWSEGKAHGLGLVTGPRGQGEFAGRWEDGFESSGVYIWPSGNTYEGEWRHGKRHGVGVEIKGRWVYRGEWMTGFKGRYGVRESEASGARYEGTWQLGMQDGAGVETYADGSTYSGCWFHGTRHGLGVRESVAFGLAAHYRDGGRLRESLTSLRSQDEESAAAVAAAGAGAGMATTGQAGADAKAARRLDESRGGFILRGRPAADPAAPGAAQGQKAKRNSLTRSLLSKLKRQRSAGDIADQRSGRYSGGSIRSTYSSQSHVTDQSSVTTAAEFFEEIVDPATKEVYYGDWKQDKRSGLGVAERSDGLRYEGEWDGNKKHGYGATTYPDGSVESGKYKCGVLVASTAKRSKLFIIKSSRLRERVETSVREARGARAEAVKKAENAQSRQFISKQKADLAEAAAEKARSDAELARKLAKEYAPDFHQPGLEFLKRRAEADMFSNITLTHGNGNRAGMATARQRTTEELPAGSGASPNTLSPNQLVDGTLQVGGGGSRRGSFRAVRRGSGGGGGGGRQQQQQQLHQQQLHQQGAASQSSGASQTPRSLAGSEQPAQQRLDVKEVASKLQAVPAAAAAPRAGPSRSPAQQHSLDRVEPLTSVHSNASSSNDHFDQYKTALPLNSRRGKRDSGLGRDSSCDDSPGSGGVRSNGSNRGDSDSGLSEASGGSSLLGRCRRRTLPSLLSAPPVRPAMVGPTLDDVTKSVENVQESTSYIVENGIRKRVQADPRGRHQPEGPPEQQSLPKHYRIESQTQLSKDLGEGSLPDVTVCQSIRRRGGLSREEASRLGEARRLELLRIEERRRQGEIIIRLADLKDWCKEHLLLVFVGIVNAGLVLLFFTILASPGAA